MSSLPQIGSGQLMVNGDVQRNAETRSTLNFDITNGTASRRSSAYPRPPSILTVSESLPSIHDSRESQSRKTRSRSLDPAVADGTQVNAKRRRENDHRSKSLDPRLKDGHRSVHTSLSESDELEYELNINEETESEKARKVRFDEKSLSPKPSKAVGSKSNEPVAQVNGHGQNIAVKRHERDNFRASDNFNRTSKIKNKANKKNVASNRVESNKALTTRQDNKVLDHYKRNDAKKDLYRNYEHISKKIKDSHSKEPVQVYSKKYQVKNWTETYSDPGPDKGPRKLKSIDNDQFIKGRPVDPRRPGFPRQQGNEQAKHEERPKAADRGKRLHSEKDDKGGGEHTARSVNSAPSKDREAPVPKLNSFMKEEKLDKDASNRGKVNFDRQTLEKAKDRHKTSEQDKPPDKAKTSVERDKEQMKEKVRREEPKENGQMDNERHRSSQNQARSERQQPQRKEHKHINLPADDHGPAFTPTTTESPLDTNKEDDAENFKYYASINKGQKERVPPLQLQSKTPTEKSFSTRIIGSDDMHLSSVSPAKSDKSKATTDVLESEKNKKKREVTIIDPKDLKKTAEEIVEEAFNKEYEYAHNEERRTKDFEEMDEDEKIEFFKSQYRMRPEQIRELTFHPKTNEPKIIHKTYTGIDATEWELAPDSARIKSGKRPKSRHTNAFKKVMVIPTYQRKDFMLSRLQGKIYRHISKVYGSSPRDNREKQFYEKLAQIQLDEYRRRYENLERNERKRLESMFRQREQLKQLRKKFEKDAWRRFMTQYVTSKVVESENSDRKDYGLPNKLDNDVSAKLRKKNLSMDPSTKEKMNKKKFEHLFKFSTGPDLKVGGKPLKFEGYDTVYIDTEDESGQHVSHRQDVAELIKEARMLLSQTEMERNEGTRQRVKSDRPPPRQAQDTRNRQVRPRHHRSREQRRPESDQSPPKRSKSRTKTPKSPKTIKDVIIRRQSNPGNRYRMSEFLKNSSKSKPTRGSNQSLDKDSSVKKQVSKIPGDKSLEQKGRKTVDETTEETVKVVTSSSSVTERELKETKTGTNDNNKQPSESTKEYLETQAKSQLNRKDDNINEVKTVEDIKKERKANVEQKPHMYLEEAETLIGTSRDYDAYSPVKNSVAKNTISRSISPVSKAGEYSRPPSKASIQAKNYMTKSPTVSKVLTTASRRGSKTSVQIHNEIKSNSGSVSPYKQATPKRTPSVASIISKSNSSIHPSAKHDTVSIQNKNISDEPQKISETVPPHRTASRTSIHTVRSSYQSDLKPYVRASKTSVRLQNDVVNDKEAVENHIYESPKSQKSAGKFEQDSTDASKQISKANHVSPSPSRLSKLDTKTEDRKHTEIINKLQESPTVKKHVNIKENVEVHTKVSAPKMTNGVQQKDKDHQSKDIMENGLDDFGTSYTDTKVKRDDFENRRKQQAHGQHERQASPKVTQTRSKSRERKGPLPKKGKVKQSAAPRSTKERKELASNRKQGKTRFPDIEQNDKTVQNARATPKPHLKRDVNINEVETETIRTVTPSASEKHGAAKWKDLVQKYLREPSPVVGKREDLSVLQTKVDTDDSESEADIFERARRRYALDVDDESDDDDE